MSGSTGSEVRSGIGARLKAGRERLGLSLLQVAEKLHVDPKVLEFLEADRFADLGAAVYARGHIKRYSELVHESAAELLELYAAATKPAPPDLTQLPKAQRSENPGRLVLPSLVILIAFALVGIVWWALQNIGSSSFGSKAVPQTVPESDLPVDVPVESPVGAVSEVPAAGPVATTPAASVSRPAASPSSTVSRAPQASTTQRSASAAPVGPALPHAGRGSVPNASGSAEPASPPQPEAATAKSLQITLKFASDSFAEVYDAKGKRLFSEIGSASSSRTLTGTPPLRVVLGNAAAVTLDVNGKPVKVPASTQQDDGARFIITRAGRAVRARSGSGGSDGG